MYVAKPEVKMYTVVSLVRLTKNTKYKNKNALPRPEGVKQKPREAKSPPKKGNLSYDIIPGRWHEVLLSLLDTWYSPAQPL